MNLIKNNHNLIGLDGFMLFLHGVLVNFQTTNHSFVIHRASSRLHGIGFGYTKVEICLQNYLPSNELYKLMLISFSYIQKNSIFTFEQHQTLKI